MAHTHSFQGDVARVDDPVYVLGGSFTDRLKSMASKALYSVRIFSSVRWRSLQNAIRVIRKGRG